MDEITIGDKIYVSSKRAAKITGYAKDYIGQLCREGRVEAKLVGRNWYVLEAAIKDHRFGKEEVLPVKAVEELQTAPRSTETWQKPQYEALEAVPIPELSLQEKVVEPLGSRAVADMQSAWREWFQDKQQMALPDGDDHFKDEYLPVIQEDTTENEQAAEETDQVSTEEVQISRIYEPEEPREVDNSAEEEQEEPVTLHRSYAARESGETVPATNVPVVDLSEPKKVAKPRARRKSESNAAVLRAVFIVLALAAGLVSLVGTGYAENLLSGTSVNLGAQRQIIDFLSGASTIDNSI